MANTKDFKVKNGIQPTVYHEGLGTAVSGAEGYFLAGASYDSVSFLFTNESTDPFGSAFNNDGTKMYVLLYGTKRIYQYSLSTAYDVSTSSYDSKSFLFTSQDTNPFGINFNNDGTKLYLVGLQYDSLYQYSLSTAFDVSTLSYDSVSYAPGQTSNFRDIIFNNDGTKFYIVDATNARLYEYLMSTAFDLSTASYNSVQYTSSQDTALESAAFNSDGTKLFIVGLSTDTVYQHSLSTAYDLSTISYDSVSFSVASEDTTPRSLIFNNDGTKMYMSGQGTDTIYQYSTALNANTLDLSTGSVFEITPTSDIQVNLSNPAASAIVSQATLLLDGAELLNNTWDISTAVYSQNYSIGYSEGLPEDIFFSPDGIYMYVIGDSNNRVYRYTLTTAWDISTVSGSNYFAVGPRQTEPKGLFFKTDGTKMYVIGTVSPRNVDEYNLSTAWDVTTASFNQDFSTSSQDTQPQSLSFKSDGTKMYIAGASGQDINEYNLSTAWNISTASFNQNFSASASSFATGLFFKPDGTKMYVTSDSNNDVDEYNLSTAWNISTASFNQHFSVSTQETAPNGLFFKPDGTNMYVIGDSGDDVNQYTIGSSSTATITYPNTIEFAGGTAPTSPAIGETDILTFSTRDGGSTYQGVLAIDGAK